MLKDLRVTITGFFEKVRGAQKSKKKMRILTVGSLPPDWGGNTIGGVATCHQTFLTELTSNPNKYNVEVAGALMLNWNRESDARPPASIPLLEYPEDTKQQKQWYKDVLANLKPDVIKFFHIGHRWAKWHVDLISDVTAVGSIHSFNQVTQRDITQSEIALLKIKSILPGLSGLIFPARHTLNQGIKLGLDYVAPTKVINNAINPLFIKTYCEDIYTNNENRNGIVFLGSLIPIKRADMVIKSAAALRVPITIIGEGEDMDNLTELANNLGYSDQVCFTGGKDAKTVIKHLKTSKMLCVPSKSEAFANVYLEALACGAPVVGFKANLDELTAELGIDVGIGVAGDCSQEELTSAIKKVLQTTWDRSLLRKAVAERFTPSIVVEQYVDFIRDVLKK